MQTLPRKSSWLDYVFPRPGIWLYPIIYLQLLTLAELLIPLGQLGAGMVLHAVTLVGMLLKGAYESNTLNRRFILSLALTPMIRLINLFLPLRSLVPEGIEAKIPTIDMYFWVGVVVYISVFYTMATVGMPPRRIGINLNKFSFQVLFGIVGFGFGLIEYMILKPAPPVDPLTIESFFERALILTVFTGMLEEIVFRGIIQEASLASYGKFGITFVAILFSVMHIGYKSFIDVLFVFFVGMIFGLVMKKTGSILGVTIAHSITNISLFLIYPLILGPLL